VREGVTPPALRLLPASVLGATMLLSSAVPAHAASSRNVLHERVRTAIAALHVARHTHVGSYDRTKDFGDWIEQGGGCDTRAVVLKTESSKPTTQNSNCTIETGRWYSYYNAATYTRAASLQIDHTVPVENVWISGAWRWTKATRVRYYNDLNDTRTLVAVDSHDNESKGDQDPATWIPSHGDCRYVRYWAAVKTRWQLSATRAEKTKLADLAASCPNKKVTITKAVIAYR
jgi:uncharacterized protein DUF1524